MSIELVRDYLKQYGIENRIQEFPVSSATVELAAKALGCEPQRIAKTLSFLVGKRPILIVAAGDARVDNGKFKGQFQAKAKMLPPDMVEPLIGHQIGGVCPFGVKEKVEVYLDISLQRFQEVFPACGSGNSAIALTLPELERYSNSLAWIDVCKDWQPLGGETVES